MMPYTLVMGTIWFLLALLVGLLIGWLLRSIIAGRQVERARSHNVDQAEFDRLNGRIRTVEVERDQLRADLAAERAGPDGSGASASNAAAPSPTSSPSAVDLVAARAALGGEIAQDDLQVIEGIGANIEDLLHGIGIRTWQELASTEVSLLTTMLGDAGPRYQTADPATWPQQATLLAAGRWADFRTLADQVKTSTP